MLTPFGGLRRRGELFVYSDEERRFPVRVVSEALREAAQGRRVLFAQLLKGGVSEQSAWVRLLVDSFEWVRPQLTRVVHSAPSEGEQQAFDAVWGYIRERSRKLDLIVLEEAGLAVQYGFITEAQLMREIDRLLGRGVDLAVTGPAIPHMLRPLATCWSVHSPALVPL